MSVHFVKDLIVKNLYLRESRDPVDLSISWEATPSENASSNCRKLEASPITDHSRVSSPITDHSLVSSPITDHSLVSSLVVDHSVVSLTPLSRSKVWNWRSFSLVVT